MSHKFKSLGIILVFIALALIFLKKQYYYKHNIDKDNNLSNNLVESSNKINAKQNVMHEYMPYQLFDQDTPLPKNKKSAGNGVSIAKLFNHDIQSSNEEFGHNMNGVIYQDRNKVEVFLSDNNEILLYRVNYGTYLTGRRENEVRKQFLLKGVGSIKYGNTYMKKYPQACYYQVLNEANKSTNNWPVYYGHHPVKEIEIYPCTFTYDELWQDGGSEYVTHEGFLIMSSEGINYELDANGITKHPVKGKIRRDFALIGVGVNLNATNERQRFDKCTAAVGFSLWESLADVINK